MDLETFWSRIGILTILLLICNTIIVYIGCCSVQFCRSVMSDSLWPMDCSTPGFPVPYHLLELAQTHVRRVSDTIQPSHPLLFPSPPVFNLSIISIFSNESVLRIKWTKYWSFSFSISPPNEYSVLTSFRMDWLDLLGVQGTLKSLLQLMLLMFHGL